MLIKNKNKIEHLLNDILAECAEWHSICLMCLCSLKTTKN